ncbi:MAG: hypothetical protein UHN02_07410 [Acutalibacteraceae bacterium]|nr:hypothetical protein [Acutalibacteraceae bacterium]
MKKTTVLSTALQIFLRFLGYHIMCLVVSFSILAFCPGVSGAYIAQGFNLGIIIMLPYMLAYKLGNDDINRVKNEVIKEDRFRGFKSGFIAYIPALLIGVVMILAKLGVVPEIFLAYYRILEAPFLPLNQALMPTVFTLNEIPMSDVLISVSVLVLPPLSVGAGYLFGYEDISFADTYFPKKKK